MPNRVLKKLNFHCFSENMQKEYQLAGSVINSELFLEIWMQHSTYINAKNREQNAALIPDAQKGSCLLSFSNYCYVWEQLAHSDALAPEFLNKST